MTSVAYKQGINGQVEGQQQYAVPQIEGAQQIWHQTASRMVMKGEEGYGEEGANEELDGLDPYAEGFNFHALSDKSKYLFQKIHATFKGVLGPLLRGRVLQKTYTILSLSLLWTSAMTYVGMLVLPPVVSVVMLSCIAIFCSAFYLGYQRSNASIKGMYKGTFLLTTFIGFSLSPVITLTLQVYTNGALLIAGALGATAFIFVTLSLYAFFSQEDFSMWGAALYEALVTLLCVSLISMFFPVLPLPSLIIAGVSICIFSGYLLYDTSRLMKLHKLEQESLVEGGVAMNDDELELMSADIASNLYLDCVNVFVETLRIASIVLGERGPRG